MRAVFIFEIILIMFYISFKFSQASITVYNIDRGLIEIKTGVFTTSYEVFWIPKIAQFGMHQNFINTLTNDCSLVFFTDNKERGSLKGIGTPKEIQEKLAKKLESLRYQMILNAFPLLRLLLS